MSSQHLRPPPLSKSMCPTSHAMLLSSFSWLLVGLWPCRAAAEDLPAVPPTVAATIAMTTTSYPLDQNSSSVIAYQYVIVVGVVAMVAVLAPLHAILPHFGRVVWHTLALLAAIASGIAAIVGASLAHNLSPEDGTLWQATPTAVFMLFLAFLIQIQVLGGWHIIQLRARFPGRIRLTALQDSLWRDDVSIDEYARMVAETGLGAQLLRFGSEPDQEAVAVAMLPTLKKWASDFRRRDMRRDSANSSGIEPPHFGSAMADVSGRSYTRHEPSGLVLLGSVRFAELWLDHLLAAIRSQPRSVLAVIHHVCVTLWWLGMIMGALSKTGFNAREDPMDMAQSVKNLRTAGIWVEALLLVVGMYAFPYTRSLVRYGTRVWSRLILLVLQTLASFLIGLFLLILVHERHRNQNLIAYAISLMISATAAFLWSLASVHSYQRARSIILSKNPQLNRAATAYIAALITRPRYGYQGSVPVMRWGDLDRNGRAALEISVEAAVSENRNIETVEERMLDNEAGQQWKLLEQAARTHVV